MKQENLLFLAGGIVLGLLVGYGVADIAGRRASGPQHAAAAAPVQAPPVQGGPPPAAGPPAGEIASLERVVAADPKNVQALTQLGNTLYDASRWNEALVYYQRALEAGPQDPNVLTDAGICYRQLRRFEEALDCFARAQKADPAHWQSLFNTVVVAGFDLGRFDAAEAALDRLRKANPSAPGLENLGRDLSSAKAARGKAS